MIYRERAYGRAAEQISSFKEASLLALFKPYAMDIQPGTVQEQADRASQSRPIKFPALQRTHTLGKILLLHAHIYRLEFLQFYPFLFPKTDCLPDSHSARNTIGTLQGMSNDSSCFPYRI